jgi:hypothetical protein
MTPDEHQRVLDELESLIADTQRTIEQFEAYGMQDDLPQDYHRLLKILAEAQAQQDYHQQAQATKRLH